MSFQLIEQLRQKAVPVDQMCRVLEVSRSGFYAARRRRLVVPVVCQASVQLKAAFAASGGLLRKPPFAHGSGIARVRDGPFTAYAVR